MVLPFVDGKVMSPGTIAADDAIIVKIVDVLKNVHTEAVFNETTYVFDIIQTYCREMKPYRLYRILLHKLTADLWWSLWAMIQDKISNLDFDYYEYGIKRYARFRKNYYDPEFGRWLEGV